MKLEEILGQCPSLTDLPISNFLISIYSSFSALLSGALETFILVLFTVNYKRFLVLFLVWLLPVLVVACKT